MPTVESPSIPRNERGVIAEHYHALQSLALVQSAREDLEFEPVSPLSFVRTVLQCCEIALYTMADLLAAGTATKLSWLRGFHRVMISLSSVSDRFSAATAMPGTPVRAADSPALREYVAALREFDRQVRTSGLDLTEVLATESLDSTDFLTLHLSRIGAHDSTIWERHLSCTAMPETSLPYDEFTSSATLREAVYEHRLTGDTYFTQFRALHQIPELLALEIGDRLEAVILALRARQVERAVEHLMWLNWLCEPGALCLPPMIDNLATSDYHEIRENLGLTSGSHSVSIRYHMFTDLFEQLCEAVPPHPAPTLLAQLAVFRGFVFGWRDAHLHLPRNNLGGDSTRSLTGSPDAVAVVRGMRDHAHAHDPSRATLLVRDAAPGPLGEYLASPESLDSAVLSATGRVTQSKFTDVQERLGFFAGKCPFSKPPRRRV